MGGLVTSWGFYYVGLTSGFVPMFATAGETGIKKIQVSCLKNRDSLTIIDFFFFSFIKNTSYVAVRSCSMVK